MKKNYPILIIFVLSLLVGFFTFDQYGESWDDKSLQKYAVKSINAYNMGSGRRLILPTMTWEITARFMSCWWSVLLNFSALLPTLADFAT